MAQILSLIVFSAWCYAAWLFFKKKDKEGAKKPAIIGLVAFIIFGVFFSDDVQKEQEAQAEKDRIELEEKKEKEEKEEKERKAKEEAEKKRQEEEKAKEEAEKKRQEEEKAKENLTDEEIIAQNEWKTDLTWDAMMRTPDDHAFTAVQISGEIQAVQQQDGNTIYQLMMNGDVNQPAMIAIDQAKLKQRFLEGDYITVYGTFAYLIDYTTVLGASKQAPLVIAEVITL